MLKQGKEWTARKHVAGSVKRAGVPEGDRRSEIEEETEGLCPKKHVSACVDMKHLSGGVVEDTDGHKGI